MPRHIQWQKLYKRYSLNLEVSKVNKNINNYVISDICSIFSAFNWSSLWQPCDWLPEPCLTIKVGMLGAKLSKQLEINVATCAVSGPHNRTHLLPPEPLDQWEAAWPGGFWQVLAACVGGGGEGAEAKKTKKQQHSFSAWWLKKGKLWLTI